MFFKDRRITGIQVIYEDCSESKGHGIISPEETVCEIFKCAEGEYITRLITSFLGQELTGIGIRTNRKRINTFGNLKTGNNSILGG